MLGSVLEKVSVGMKALAKLGIKSSDINIARDCSKSMRQAVKNGLPCNAFNGQTNWIEKKDKKVKL